MKKTECESTLGAHAGATRPFQRTSRRSSGFTLVEVLVVIAILATLFGMVVVTAGTFMGRASTKATVSMVLRLQTWLDEYRGLTGAFPPDGLDTSVETPEGTELRGSASLHYFLTTDVVAEEIIGSRRRKREHPRVASLEKSELSEPTEDTPDATEIIDGWKVGFHYDNTSNGRFTAQDGSVHYPPEDEIDILDPREEGVEIEVSGQKAVVAPGFQGDGYDLWSHGDDSQETQQLPIGSWNVSLFK